MTKVTNTNTTDTKTEYDVQYSAEVEVSTDGLAGYQLFEATLNNLVFGSNKIAQTASLLAEMSMELTLPEAIKAVNNPLFKEGDYPRRVAMQIRYLVAFRKIALEKGGQDQYITEIKGMLAKHPLVKVSKLVQALGLYRYRKSLQREKFIPSNAPILASLHEGGLEDLGFCEEDLVCISSVAESLKAKFTTFSDEEREQANKLLEKARKDATLKRQSGADALESAEQEVEKLSKQEQDLLKKRDELASEVLEMEAKKAKLKAKEDDKKSIQRAIEAATTEKDSKIKALTTEVEKYQIQNEKLSDSVELSESELRKKADTILKTELADSKLRIRKLESLLNVPDDDDTDADTVEPNDTVETNDTVEPEPERELDMEVWVDFRLAGASDLLALIVKARKARKLADKNQLLDDAKNLLTEAMK